ncbi:MAG TPA: NAD(+)/NADH kinase [Rubricoccaceae bacterium]
MTYGITGNPGKSALWPALAEVTAWLGERGLAFRLDRPLADGLATRGLATDAHAKAATDDPAGGVDVLLSFGGDGTLLRSAHLAGTPGPPVLGVNIGRLGFLTRADVDEVTDVLALVEAGRHRVEARTTLDVTVEGADVPGVPAWALNDVVVDKSGTTSMIQIEATVDGVFLNTYWADGLVVATPTGSTAYALSVGGPIVVPSGAETDVVVVAPIAPHTLTARPIVLPASCDLVLRVATRDDAYAFAVDGISALIPGGAAATIRIGRSARTVRLVTLPGRDVFATLRDKLSWGKGGVF